MSSTGPRVGEVLRWWSTARTRGAHGLRAVVTRVEPGCFYTRWGIGMGYIAIEARREAVARMRAGRGLSRTGTPRMTSLVVNARREVGWGMRLYRDDEHSCWWPVEEWDAIKTAHALAGERRA